MDVFGQWRRLGARDRASRGLVVDEQGAMLGADCLLIRRTAKGYRCIGPAEAEGKSAWTDEQLVEPIRKWAIEQSPDGYNAVRANRIADRELFPSQAILAARGLDSLRRLLPLLRDEHPNVQLIAAGFAYDVEPLVCRAVLEQLMTSMSAVGLSAWAMLTYKNPDDPPDPKLIGSSSSSDSDDDKPES